MLIDIIYASTSGNVEAVCEKVAEVLKSMGHEARLYRSERTDIQVLIDSEFAILSTSTWEHGELNPFMKNFYDQMEGKDFSGKKAAFIGLGDSRYEAILFCEGLEILKKRFLDNKGIPVGETLLINGEPYSQLDTKVVEWARAIVKLLNSSTVQ